MISGRCGIWIASAYPNSPQKNADHALIMVGSPMEDPGDDVLRDRLALLGRVRRGVPARGNLAHQPFVLTLCFVFCRFGVLHDLACVCFLSLRLAHCGMCRVCEGHRCRTLGISDGVGGSVGGSLSCMLGVCHSLEQ